MNILCFDIGTTNIKIGFYQNIIRTVFKTIPVQSYQTEDNYTIQKPDQIIRIINHSIKELSAQNYNIEMISFSTPMHTLIYHDEIVLWSDLRANEWVRNFKKHHPKLAQRFYQRTGTPIHPMSPFAKIGHFKEIKGEHLDFYYSLKEYLMNYYAGEYVIDYSSASATGLFNLTTMSWDKEVLQFLEINDNQLAKLADTDYTTIMLAQRKRELGLTEDVKVHIGATDGCLASLAALENEGTNQVITLGTSGAARKIINQPITAKKSKKIQNFCYYVSKDQWVIGGATNNGGNILNWLANLLFEDQTQFYEQIPSVLNEIAPGSDGLKIFPYLNGERAPLWDADVEASIQRLKTRHSRKHFMKATVESILFNIRTIAQGLNFNGPVSLNGGFFQIEGSVQLAANILQRPVSYTKASEPMDGLMALIYKQREIEPKNYQLIHPQSEQMAIYNTIYEQWMEEFKTVYL